MAGLKPVEKFLSDSPALIVEPSPTFSSSLQACLYELGAPNGKILVCRKFEDAVKLIKEKQPKLLVTEYQIDAEFGLALIEHHEKNFVDTGRISMLVTRNSSDSVVAEAAEEQVDAFILKPFSPDIFQQKLMAVIERKMNPTPYLHAVKLGKELMSSNEYDKAVRAFSQAKKLNPKPTLACFYLGEVYRLMGDPDQALTQFKEGRVHQSLHYKCLVAEFEALLTAKRYGEAFELVGPLKKNYPLTPRRLSQIFIATVFTRRFEDIGDYYALLLKLDQRSPELVKVASMALFTAGKFYLEKNDLVNAVSLFDKAVLTVGRDLVLIEKVISELVKVKALAEARAFVSKVGTTDVGSPQYNRMAFKVDQLWLRPDQLIENGRKLVNAGEATPEVYEAVVRLAAQTGKLTLAESLIGRALKDYPDLRALLYKILEDPASVKMNA